MVVGEGALEEVDASGWVGGGRSGDQGRGGSTTTKHRTEGGDEL